MEKQEIEKLAIAIKSGDEESFRFFFEAYSERIFKFLLTILRNPVDAEDVTSIAFTYVWNKRVALKKPDQLVSLLYQVAKHRAFDLIRRESGRFNLPIEGYEEVIEDHSPSLEKLTDQELIKKKVEDLLAQLGPQERALLYLRFYEDLDFNQIADRLDCTAVSARVKLHRLLKKIRVDEELVSVFNNNTQLESQSEI